MRERPSAEVNSVMMSPQPDCWFEVSSVTSAVLADAVNWLAFLMNRRKTVSVTPAIGASTVAGAIFTPPILTLAGTPTFAGIACSTGLSQYLCMLISVYRDTNPEAAGMHKAGC